MKDLRSTLKRAQDLMTHVGHIVMEPQVVTGSWDGLIGYTKVTGNTNGCQVKLNSVGFTGKIEAQYFGGKLHRVTLDMNSSDEELELLVSDAEKSFTAWADKKRENKGAKLAAQKAELKEALAKIEEEEQQLTDAKAST